MTGRGCIIQLPHYPFLVYSENVPITVLEVYEHIVDMRARGLRPSQVYESPLPPAVAVRLCFRLAPGNMGRFMPMAVADVDAICAAFAKALSPIVGGGQCLVHAAMPCSRADWEYLTTHMRGMEGSDLYLFADRCEPQSAACAVHNKLAANTALGEAVLPLLAKGCSGIPLPWASTMDASVPKRERNWLYWGADCLRWVGHAGQIADERGFRGPIDALPSNFATLTSIEKWRLKNRLPCSNVTPDAGGHVPERYNDLPFAKAVRLARALGKPDSSALQPPRTDDEAPPAVDSVSTGTGKPTKADVSEEEKWDTWTRHASAIHDLPPVKVRRGPITDDDEHEDGDEGTKWRKKGKWSSSDAE